MIWLSGRIRSFPLNALKFRDYYFSIKRLTGTCLFCAAGHWGKNIFYTPAKDLKRINITITARQTRITRSKKAVYSVFQIIEPVYV
jgi:hypothetical protein